MKNSRRLLSVSLAFAINGVSVTAGAAAVSLDDRIESALVRSLPRMACNISATRWKKKIVKVVDGEPSVVEIPAAPGSVLASRQVHDPDYMFHWLRDSSLVIESLVRFLPATRGSENEERVHTILRDFIRFSAKLQKNGSPFGISDPRHNVDGSVDSILWARPQSDGPALRVLALLPFYRDYRSRLEKADRELLKQVIRADLDEVARVHLRKSFDLWEYFWGHHFNTRVVMLGALELGIATLPKVKHAWVDAAEDLRRALPAHWSSAKGHYDFSVGELTNDTGQPVGPPGGGLDSSMVMAVVHGKLTGARYSFRDDRMLVTARKLEHWYRANFPINRDHQQGPAVGRHPGDGYYGGNAWVFTTMSFAEFYFLRARAIESGDRWIAGPLNREALSELLGREVRNGENVTAPRKARRAVVLKLREKGEAFLRTLLDVLPANGMMSEQFDKETGVMHGARDVTWSYAGFLAAVLAREKVGRSEVNFGAIDFRCEAELP